MKIFQKSSNKSTIALTASYYILHTRSYIQTNKRNNAEGTQSLPTVTVSENISTPSKRKLNLTLQIKSSLDRNSFDNYKHKRVLITFFSSFLLQSRYLSTR